MSSLMPEQNEGGVHKSRINISHVLHTIFYTGGSKMDLLSALSKSKSVKFLLIESVIWLFTDSPVKKYISLLNQLIITNWISGKNIFTVKSVNFHWSNQWNFTDLQ